ncbi:MAG: class I SAM-dependent methyltransferase [Nostoc sp.]
MNNFNKVAQKSKWLIKCMFLSTEAERLSCPSCGSYKSKNIDSKFMFSQLRECEKCYLRFRTPTDSIKDNYEYYQNEYSLGFTTDLPDAESLEKLLKSNFENHEKSYKDIINLLKSVYPNKNKLVDFGCSWGYGSWQFKKADFLVLSYEISKPRADFAAKYLGINMIDISNTLNDNKIDIFFSNHVLEHVPSPSETIALAKKILKPDGIFVAITPNGSDSYRINDYTGWHSLWGQNHPNHLSDTFYKQEFKDNPFFLSSMPYNLSDVIEWNQNKNQAILSCSSSELLLLAYPNMKL